MRNDFAYNQQTVKPRMLKFKLNITINENVICGNFGDYRSRDRESRQKTRKKTAIFGLKSC